MAFFEFPHTRTYDSDLGWLIKRVNDQQTQMDGQQTYMEELKAWMDVNEPRIEHIEEVYDLFESGVLPQEVVTALENWLNEYGVLDHAKAYTDTQIETVQENINAEALARGAADDVLQNEIDQLIAPTGTAPSAAEVENARIGADGTIYNTLGDAIRTQVTELTDAQTLSRMGYYKPELVSGEYFNNTTGAISQHNGFFRTDYLYCKDLTTIKINNTGASGQSTLNVFFDVNYAFISSFAWNTGETIVTVPSNAVYFGLSGQTPMQNINVAEYAINKLENDVDAAENDITYINNQLSYCEKRSGAGTKKQTTWLTGVKSVSGTINSGQTDFVRIEEAVTPGELYYVTGLTFNAQFPAYMVLNSRNEILLKENSQTRTEVYETPVLIPEGASLIIVNGSNLLGWHYPTLYYVDSTTIQDKLADKTSTANNISIDTELDHFICYGQSWSVGYSLTEQPVLSKSIYENLMLEGGVLAWKSTSPDRYNSLVPLHEANTSNRYFESPVTAQCDMVKYLLNNENNFTEDSRYQLIGSAPGEGSTTIDQLSRGTVYYQYLLDYVTACKTIADNSNKIYEVSAVSWIQADANATKINKLQQDLDADIKAITGQTRNVKLITWCKEPHSYSEAVYDAFVAIHNTNPNIICAFPGYVPQHINDGVGAPNNIHFTSYGNIMCGEYFGVAFKRAIIDGEDYKPLSPESITIKGTTILLKLHVPVAPINVDTVNIESVANYGFKLTNSGGTEKTINVSLVGTDTIKIKCATTVSTSDILSYGYNSSDWTSYAPAEIARGNICDSQNIKSRSGRPLHNYLVPFKKTLSYFM